MNLAVASPAASVYSETFIRMQMERLNCTFRIHGIPVAEETVPGGPIAPLRSWRGLVETAYWCGLKRETTWQGPQAAELKRRLRRHRIDVVLANYGSAATRILPVCRALSVPLVAHFHGVDAHRHDVVRRLGDAYRTLGRDAAAIVAVSTKMKRALLDVGIPEAKIRLVRYGVDHGRFAPRSGWPRQPIFFGVGRLVDKKAPYLTLAAFAEVHRRHPEAKLVLAGDGALLEVTANLARALGVEGAVSLVGVLEPEEVSEWMQKALAFVQHSITPLRGPSAGDSEGTPVAVLESMMSGLPVVSTRHAGIEEVVDDGRTGLLVDERDTHGMARAMTRLVEERGLAERMSEAARERALAHYTAERYIGDLRGILEAAAR